MRMPSSWMCYHASLLTVGVPEELVVSFFRVERIPELGNMLAVTSRLAFLIVTAMKTSNLL